MLNFDHPYQLWIGVYHTAESETSEVGKNDLLPQWSQPPYGVEEFGEVTPPQMRIENFV